MMILINMMAKKELEDLNLSNFLLEISTNQLQITNKTNDFRIPISSLSVTSNDVSSEDLIKYVVDDGINWIKSNINSLLKLDELCQEKAQIKHDRLSLTIADNSPYIISDTGSSNDPHTLICYKPHINKFLYMHDTQVSDCNKITTKILYDPIANVTSLTNLTIPNEISASAANEALSYIQSTLDATAFRTKHKYFITFSLRLRENKKQIIDLINQL